HTSSYGDWSSDVCSSDLIEVQARGDVAHHVLDELRVVVTALGHVLLVGALENPVQLAGGLALGDLDQLLDPHVAAQPRGDGDVQIGRASCRERGGGGGGG